MDSTAAESASIRVWDPLIRVFHWTLVIAFSLAWLTSEDRAADFHAIAGYVILGLVALRLAWGVIGTHHARFVSFVRHPREGVRYLVDLYHRRGHPCVGHNPAAAWMVVTLLASLTLTGVTGLMAYGAKEGLGPMGAVMPPWGEAADLLGDMHGVLAGFTLFLVGLHVAGVMASSLVHRENLVRAMITGQKKVREVPTGEPDPGASGPAQGMRLGLGSGWVAGVAMAVLLGAFLAAAGAAVAAPASAVNDRLTEYRGKGAGPFSADAGRKLFEATYTVEGEKRNCAACHTTDLKKKGKHQETGKPIDPLAPSVTTDRLTDSAKIEKWFLRNCKWTIGRPCTPQEKGDVLMFLQTQ
ncbi:MAG: DUF1924 domain-containing protein [Nitrospirota bacterium]|nr:DUF1924 domain-containing protein [Nitrospirota bacterium]